MPLIDGSNYDPSWPYRNGHLNTIFPNVFGRKVKTSFKRERLVTPDSDFIDVDHSSIHSSRVVYLLHGLEGSSSSTYILNFTHFFNAMGIDVIAMNYRGCSGEMNKRLTMYNSGTTEDLHFVLKETIGGYQDAFLMGFSLGGNLALKYLGEQKFRIPREIRRCIAISTPVHLSNASQALLRKENMLYQLKFLRSLFFKLRKKKKQYPDQISLKPFLKIRNLYDFDNFYTAPLFGYRDAEDYYAQNQSVQFLQSISIPTLIVNALDDPFLGDLCYPYGIAEDSDLVSLCAPAFGGHVGFYSRDDNPGWLENVITHFLA
jgi:predicted alpha/beta-fold hydrolase